MNIGFGFSQTKDHIRAANEAVGQAIISLGNVPADLAIIFTTIEVTHPLVLKTVNALLGEIPILGCSSLGIITNKGIFKHGFAILLIGLSRQMFLNVAAVKDVNKKTPLLAGRELGEKLLYGCKNVRRNLSIIFSDGLITEGTSLINGLQENLGRSFPLIGAFASDNFTFQKTFQYFNKELLSESCCGVLFGGGINFGLGIKHGWKPLGKMRCASKSQGNIIKEIDGQAAVKLYEDYLAKDTLELSRELRRISIFYPIGIYLPGEKEYLLRNIISIKDDGSLVTQGDIPQDSKIRLMIGTKDSCLDAAADSCEEAKKNLLGQKVKFVMVFDSASRFSLLGRQCARELEIIKKTFGEEIPLIGIYTYGEQAPLSSINYLGRSYFHNQSISVLAVGDR
ncbi:MAG: FIST C-terminal domain-containing protein [Candidatus Omnitrophica bacterium]|nr:FIST C-terminal domain-containing protein [Candidatus Omnitrophota bacterium]